MELTERAVYQHASSVQPVRDAVSGRKATKYYIGAGLVVALVLLTWTIGYPFVIVCALTGTALALTTIVLFTAADLFVKTKPAVSAKGR